MIISTNNMCNVHINIINHGTNCKQWHSIASKNYRIAQTDIGKFKIINQSSIAAGIRRVEALRDKQLQEYLSEKEKLSDLSSQKNEVIIKDLSKKIIKSEIKTTLIK